ncbi:hypothetical protein JOB18_026671 [Solea senegalensis]|uniref:Zinc finger C2HC domain-containing protein 1A n=2 Tax=Solea senegalensis TaxID=28829 RepID=A0AAV6RIM6_SOLSE|nr:hypothetical protein JOB18_026671 [Solea senegalensis]
MLQGETDSTKMNGQENTAQCNTCKRWFFLMSLNTHAKICEKLTSKKRQVFDSRKQRVKGTDIAAFSQKSKHFSATVTTEASKKTNNWRKTHEDLIATVRAARACSKAMKEGVPLPPPLPAQINPDYIQCPYCQRRFNDIAAGKHIEFCKKQALRMPNKSKIGSTKKAPSRTQYKPPAPVKVPSSPAMSSIPSTSSLQQRSGPRQPTRIPSRRVSSSGSDNSNPSGPASPLSGVETKTRSGHSGFGSVRNNHPGIGLNKKRVDNDVYQNYANGANEADNGGMKGKFCYKCGSKYPVDSAKFCCECGVKRLYV